MWLKCLSQRAHVGRRPAASLRHWCSPDPTGGQAGLRNA